MKKFRLLCVLISAVMLASCSGNTAEEEISEKVSESTVTTSETTVETTSETTTETTTEQVTEATTETEAEEVPQAAEEKYMQVSPDTEFIDYEFIEDYQGTTDIGELADKAVEFLKNSEYYAESMENIAEFTDEEFAEYIRDGVIEPQIAASYPAGYDGDGKTETFIIVNMPMRVRNTFSHLYSFFIFADSGGNMTLLDYNCAVYNTVLLNYGNFKQITFGGGGTMGAEDCTCLYGVEDGKVKHLYIGRGWFYKEDCFLSFFGWQGVGNFMYYDTVAREYRGIDGVTVPEETIRAMDTDNVFENYYSETGNAGPEPFKLVGGKYYMAVFGVSHPGDVYVYEDGKFKYLAASIVRTNNDPSVKTVTDIDIEQALANMKPVQK